jgi:hypothetical protein
MRQDEEIADKVDADKYAAELAARQSEVATAIQSGSES